MMDGYARLCKRRAINADCCNGGYLLWYVRSSLSAVAVLCLSADLLVPILVLADGRPISAFLFFWCTFLRPPVNRRL